MAESFVRKVDWMNVAKVCKASKPYPSPIRNGKCVLFVPPFRAAAKAG
jgi:hypothetical protein